jgi:hypothetical protein
MRYLYLMLALCLPFALGFTALAVRLDTFGLVWLAVVLLLLACPPYAVGAVKIMQRLEARSE